MFLDYAGDVLVSIHVKNHLGNTFRRVLFTRIPTFLAAANVVLRYHARTTADEIRAVLRFHSICSLRFNIHIVVVSSTNTDSAKHASIYQDPGLLSSPKRQCPKPQRNFIAIHRANKE